MPLMDPQSQKVKKQTPKPEERKTAAVYEKPNEPQKYATYFEGRAWTVTYYSQILGEDDYPSRLDMAKDPSLQNYMKIVDLELMLPEDEFNNSRNPTMVTDVNGTANVFPGIPVNQYDHFIAKNRDGSTAVWMVSEAPTPITWYDYHGHEITFELLGYLDQSFQYEFKRKTVDVRYFDKNNPTCPGSNVKRVDNYALIRNTLKTVVSMLYEQYYDQLTRTFILFDESTEKTTRKYDGNLVNFVREFLPAEIRGARPVVTQYATPTGQYRSLHKTIWDVLLDGDLARMGQITHTVADVSTEEFNSPFISRGIGMIHIDQVVHPGDGDLFEGTINPDSTRQYVFEEAFYQDDEENMTDLESMVRKALRNENYDTETITDWVKELHTYSYSERFYRLAVYLWLLRIRIEV